MERIICVAIGYVFGLIQSGYLYGRIKHIDIRQHGSGNAGSTNVLRVMGTKAGAVVFLGDFFKAVAAICRVRVLLCLRLRAAWICLPCMQAWALRWDIISRFTSTLKAARGSPAWQAIMTAMDWRITLTCFVVFARRGGCDQVCVSGIHFGILAVFSRN